MGNKVIAGLVVAAGLSSRMKEFKPLMMLGEKTFIEHVVDTLIEGGVQEVIVVTGNRAKEIEEQLASRRARFIRNESYASTSMFQSVILGLEYLKNRCDGFFLTPGDIPLFRSSSLRAMERAMEDCKSPVVQPMYKNKHGHPVLFSADCIPEFLAHDGTNGLKGAMENLSAEKVELVLPDKGILMDADTQEDYRALKDYYYKMQIPTPEICMEILKYFKADPWTVDHCIAVAGLAKEFASKLKSAGHSLDIQLVEAAALLHDTARREKEHAACGGKWIRELGYPKVAGVVESHMDLPQDSIDKMDERAIVYLADKLFTGNTRVSLEDRFGRSFSRFKDNSRAMNAANRRYNNAKKVLKNIEDKLGGMTTYENSFGS